MDWIYWEQQFADKVLKEVSDQDPAHDLSHFKRVVKMAKDLCQQEAGRLEVVIPAAWLHDLVIIPKDSPLRREASKLSAQKAQDYLHHLSYPSQFLEDIGHAIEAHSFSAGIEAKTLEAKIVQDADRLDALGAIGIARCFAIAGLLKRPFYHDEDPFCATRGPDDSQYTLDHFYIKLFKVPETLKTQAGQREGRRRVEEMRKFLDALVQEIGS